MVGEALWTGSQSVNEPCRKDQAAAGSGCEQPAAVCGGIWRNSSGFCPGPGGGGTVLL